MTRRLTVSLLLSVFFVLAAHAAEYERILLPVAASGDAALGSKWRTDVWVRNDGSVPVQVFPFGAPCFVVSSRCLDFVPVSSLEPHRPLAYFTINDPTSLFPDLIPISDKSAGIIVYVAPTADAVRFSVHVRDVSRTDQNIGTEIPAVRERELLSDTASLSNVLVMPNYRYALRIYAIDVSSARFTIHIFEPGLNGTENELLQQDVELVRPTVTINCGTHPGPCPYPDVPYVPAYAFVPLELLALGEKSPTRVEIEPKSPVRFWTVLSATNNDTQLVTTYSPR
jgi:hypothetical protein